MGGKKDGTKFSLNHSHINVNICKKGKSIFMSFQLNSYMRFHEPKKKLEDTFVCENILPTRSTCDFRETMQSEWLET